MHTEIPLALGSKDKVGKGAARKLRAAGKTPGVVYGPELAPVMVTFREQDLVKALSTPAQRNVFLRIQSADERIDGARVIVKDLQVDPLHRQFVHADFYKLDPSRKLQVTVPIQLAGTAAGVKMGGIMQVARRNILVSCLPDDLPEAIVVDVSALLPGHSIHIADLESPPGVQILSSPKLAVCAVIAPSGLKEEEAEAEAEEELEEGEEAAEEATEE